LPRNQLPLEEILRAIEIGLRQPKVGLALPNRSRRDFIRGLRRRAFQRLVVLDFGNLLPAGDGRRATPTHRFESAATLGTASMLRADDCRRP
jgi:hypothetical protein